MEAWEGEGDEEEVEEVKTAGGREEGLYLVEYSFIAMVRSRLVGISSVSARRSSFGLISEIPKRKKAKTISVCGRWEEEEDEEEKKKRITVSCPRIKKKKKKKKEEEEEKKKKEEEEEVELQRIHTELCIVLQSRLAQGILERLLQLPPLHRAFL